MPLTSPSASPADVSPSHPMIAVAIPCYNEAPTIATVVKEFLREIPTAQVHVFDNRSSDDSYELARAAGATMHRVNRPGKGRVMQAIFETIPADVILVVDGDHTYSSADAPKLIDPVVNGEADMVVGNRLHELSPYAMRRLHQLGNSIILIIINSMFATDQKDLLSGYRAFSKRFVDTIAVQTSGFEVETELTVCALVNDMRIVEVPVSYRNRIAGSVSKLRTFHDGYRIMLTAAILLRDYYPLRTFSVVALIFGLMSLVAGLLRLLTYLDVPTLPVAALTAMALLFGSLSLLSFSVGLILNTINIRFRVLTRLLVRHGRINGRIR